MTPGHSFVVIPGRRDDVWQAFTVDLGNGEVLHSVPKAQGAPRLFLVPPDAWLKFEAQSKPEPQGMQ